MVSQNMKAATVIPKAVTSLTMLVLTSLPLLQTVLGNGDTDTGALVIRLCQSPFIGFIWVCDLVGRLLARIFSLG